MDAIAKEYVYDFDSDTGDFNFKKYSENTKSKLSNCSE
jgi:hypothetical protein